MSRSAAEILGILRKSGLRIFRTGDFALLTGLQESAAVKALTRLAEQDLTVRLRRGIWASRFAENLHPYEMVPHLTAPWPSYVSLHSVLSDEGVVEEIPHVIYAVTSGRPAKFDTPLGQVHVHHLPQRLMWGFGLRQNGQGIFPVAEKEKAFLDLVYLGLSRRSPLRVLHKRGRKWNLDVKRLRELNRKFDNPAVTAYLKKENLAG